MTNTEGSGIEARATSSEPSAAATFVASWGALAGAARAALSMIPTSEEGRIRQEPLVRELERAAGLPGVAPHATVPAGARQLVETTLRGLREPASTRPYDAERAHALRRRVLAYVASAADEVVGVELRPGSRERAAVVGALRAALLAREVLADEPPTATAGASR